MWSIYYKSSSSDIWSSFYCHISLIFIRSVRYLYFFSIHSCVDVPKQCRSVFGRIPYTGHITNCLIARTIITITSYSSSSCDNGIYVKLKICDRFTSVSISILWRNSHIQIFGRFQYFYGKDEFTSLYLVNRSTIQRFCTIGVFYFCKIIWI